MNPVIKEPQEDLERGSVKKIRNWLKDLINVLDIVLAILALLFFFIGLKYLPYYISEALHIPEQNLVAHVEDILSYIILLAILLELTVVLVRFSTFVLIDTLIFIIVRKLLRPSISTLDIFLGVSAVVLLIFARKYGFSKEEKEKKF